MTEAQWLTCTDPSSMPSICQIRTSNRKLGLFAVACCRRIWDLIPVQVAKQCVEVTERYLDGTASDEDLQFAIHASIHACNAESRRNRQWTPIESAVINAVGRIHRSETGGRQGVNLATARARANAEYLRLWLEGKIDSSDPDRFRKLESFEKDEHSSQAVLLRDILGNLFTEIAFDPRWQTSTVLDLAHAIYDQRAFDQMPILADALMDAGCDCESIIDHCRQAGEHVRGCWVVDLLMGRT